MKGRPPNIDCLKILSWRWYLLFR